MDPLDSLAKVFLSNQTEALYQFFRQELFAHSHPLTRRVVIVPSAAMKSWLMLQMANDSSMGIAAGIEVEFLDAAIQKLSRKIAKTPSQSGYEPTPIELALTIESLIKDGACAFTSMTPSEQKIWRPLLSYLGCSTGISELSLKISKRLNALASSLATLFAQYGLHGCEMVARWKKNNVNDWQVMLWHKLEEHFVNWNYPCKKLQAFEVDMDWKKSDIQIHLFGLSHVCPLYENFFTKISKHLPVNYYLLSPCQQFWSDILSEKEKSSLVRYWSRKGASQIQINALESVLKDGNALLANLGKLGREMACRLEQSEAVISEHYLLPATIAAESVYEALLSYQMHLNPTNHPLTMLEAVQSDMALLRNPENSPKISLSADDQSIQVHVAPKIHREVEAIYDAILKIIEKHAKDDASIHPSDILVMSPNIEKYAPFVKCVFNRSECPFQIQLMDIHSSAKFELVEAFLSLLNLTHSRWDVSSLFKLFEYPVFHKRHGLTKEDVSMFREWTDQAGVRWGNDENHREEVLKRNHCQKQSVDLDGRGTWRYGLNALLEGLVMQSSENMLEDSVFTPIAFVESSQGALLGIFIGLIESLLSDLQPLTGVANLTLTDWVAYLNCLCETYFVCDGEFLESYQILQEHLNEIEQATTKLSAAQFSFHSIKTHLQASLNAPLSQYRESNLQAVRFCSLLPMRAVPAKVIVLMGMNEGSFPRLDKTLSHNLLNNEKNCIPSQIDYDRYLFLEALLSTRNYFICSYSNQQAGENQTLLPSLLVTEMLNYLDKAFEIADGLPSASCIYKHHLNAYDKTHFLHNSPTRSFSQFWHKAALAHYHKNKQQPHTFVSSVELPVDAPVNKDKGSLSLSELTAFSKKPHKNYLNKALGIYIDDKDKNEREPDDSFLLDNLESSILLRQLVLASQASAKDILKTNSLPKGPFKQIEAVRVVDEAEKLSNTLLAGGVNPKEIFSLEFNAYHQKPICEGKKWLLPALKIHIPNYGDILLSGKFETVSTQGLIVFAEDKIEEAIKVWPQVLAFCCLAKKFCLPVAHQLLFAKSKKLVIKDVNFDQAEHLLQQFIEYYFKNMQTLSPLLPTWVPHLLSGDSSALQKELKNDEEGEFTFNYDEYLKWLKRTSPGIDAQSIMSNWQSVAQELYADMNHAFYPKKVVKFAQENVDDLI